MIRTTRTTRIIRNIVLSLFSFALLLPSANVLTVQKTTYEVFNLGVDFTAVIGAHGTTLVSVTALSTSTQQDVTSQIIASSPVPGVVGSTDVVSFRVRNGAARQTYAISVKVADTVTGEQYEGVVNLVISQQ